MTNLSKTVRKRIARDASFKIAADHHYATNFLSRFLTSVVTQQIETALEMQMQVFMKSIPR